MDRVSPMVKLYVRNFPSLSVWGDYEIKSILHRFDQIGGYDREGVVVHFTQDGKTSANEGGVSQISTTAVAVMTSTFETVAALLLRQNMLLARYIGSEMPCNLDPQMGKEMDLNHVYLFRESSALLTGLQTCQPLTPNVFQTPDPVLNQSKGVSTNQSLASHLGSEMLSQLQPQMAQESSPILTQAHTCESSSLNLLKTPHPMLNQSNGLSTNPRLANHPGSDMPSQLQPEMAKEMDLNHVHPSGESSPQIMGVHRSETSTPNEFKTPDPMLQKYKGPDTRKTRKRRIELEMDEAVCSPSPVKGFKSPSGLSRGWKKKFPNANLVPSLCVNDNVEVHDEPPRLRQPDELKKSQFQRSPYTKDGL